MCSVHFRPYISAGYPLLWVNTHEERRSIQRFASELKDKEDRNIYSWDVASGLSLHKYDKGKLVAGQVTDIDPESAADPYGIILWAEEKLPSDSILILKDFHVFLNSGQQKAQINRQLRNLIKPFSGSGRTIIIMSSKVEIPCELEKEITVIPFKLPDVADLKMVLSSVCNATGAPYPSEDEYVLKAGLGMTEFEAENAFSIALVEKKAFDIEVIQREKAAVIKKTNLLEVVTPNVSIDDVGGLDNLKKWLELRRKCFGEKAHEFGCSAPKGLLLVGVPGTGKSLTAKAVANMYQRPLLRLDMGNIYGGLVGESEQNIHQAIGIAEAVSPDILWIDELEKAFGGLKDGGGGDSGTSKRVFGTFLQWLSDKTSDVFVVATANDVSALPPELLRSGRFDVIFWVDLPDDKQREEIFAIHLSKKKRDPSKFDLKKVAALTEGYSGAEIENIVNEALVHAFANDKELSDTILQSVCSEIRPISRLMAEDIEKARKWAERNDAKFASSKSAPKVNKATTSNRKVNLGPINSTGPAIAG